MSFGKQHSTTTGTQQATSNESLDPQIMSLLQGNYGRAQSIADTPYQPYTGQLVAGFNNDQLNAQQQARDISTNNVGQGILGQAVGAAASSANYQPQTVTASSYNPQMATAPQAQTANSVAAQTGGYNPASISTAGQSNNAGAASINRGDIQNISAGNGIDQSQIDRYMNPYQNDVINTTMADLERQRQIEQVQNSGMATRAHAFNGTGAAVLANGTNDNYTRALASQIAALRSQGYTQALGQANTDQQQRMAADLANQGVDLNVAGQNAGYQQQTGITNANNANQTAQFNATAQNQGAQFNAGNAQQEGQFNASNQQQTNLANQQAANSNNQFNAGILGSIEQGNQGAANTAGQFNATNQQAAALANQSAGLAGADLNLQGSQALAQMSTQDLTQAITRAGLVGGVGDAQQANAQQLLDSLYAQYGAAQNWPLQIQQLLNQSAGLLGNPTLTNTQSTGTNSSRSSGWQIGTGGGGGGVPMPPVAP